MPNYNETNVSGTKWTRACQARINNPLNGVSSITFKEEEVANFGDDQIIQRAGSVSDSLTDPATTFDLLNPTDDSVIGSMTYGEVYAALYSLYRKLADERDTKAAE